MMVRYLIRFSYIGTKYKGIQKLLGPLNEFTVQGILEEALKELKPVNQLATTTCSRTDKGVHALSNALHVDLEHRMPGETYQPYRMTEILNMYLRNKQHDIVVTKTCVVPDTFNARHAEWRSYIYRLALLNPAIKRLSNINGVYDEYLPICERDRCYITHGSLDLPKVQEAVKLFRGTHDFTTFSNVVKDEPKNPVKTMYDVNFYPVPDSRFMTDPLYQNFEMWELYIRGNSFLYHQIRKIVATLLAVGYGKLSVSRVKELLEARCPAELGLGMAPAEGLYLAEIGYSSKAFQRQQDEQPESEDIQESCATEVG